MAEFKKKSIADYETEEADDAFFASRLTPAASTQAYSYGNISEADREVARSLEGAATPPAPAATRGLQTAAAWRGAQQGIEMRGLAGVFDEALEEEQGGFQFEDTLPEMKQTAADIKTRKKKT